MCTGGAYRPFLHDRHFSAASSFQIGVSRGRRIASSGRLACLAAMAHDLKPAVAAVEALRDGRGWLRRSAKAFHLFGPEQAFGGVRFANGFLCPLARMLGMNLRTADPVTKNA